MSRNDIDWEANSDVHFLPADRFLKKFSPGEYHTNWQGVSRNWEFKKGQSVQDLAAEISDSGVIEHPLVVHSDSAFGGFVMDGHHRALAARKAGVEVPFHLVNDPHYADQIDSVKQARYAGGGAL
jgi:hypothetical protein